VEISNSSINPSSIVDILTLRYDPSINPNLPKKTWKDFEPIEKPFWMQLLMSSQVIIE